MAEYLDAPVVVTMMGKGVFPEDHPLAAEHTGSNGTAGRQPHDPEGRRDPRGRHPVRRADLVLLRGWHVVLGAADRDRPPRHRPDRDRQELPDRGRRRLRCEGRDSPICSTRWRIATARRAPSRPEYRAEIAELASEVAGDADGSLDRQALAQPGPARGPRGDAPGDDRDRLRRATPRSRPSRSSSATSRGPGSAPAATRPWATRCPRRSVPSSPSPIGRWSASPVTATSSRRSRSWRSRPRPGRR